MNESLHVKMNTADIVRFYRLNKVKDMEFYKEALYYRKNRLSNKKKKKDASIFLIRMIYTFANMDVYTAATDISKVTIFGLEIILNAPEYFCRDVNENSAKIFTHWFRMTFKSAWISSFYSRRYGQIATSYISDMPEQGAYFLSYDGTVDSQNDEEVAVERDYAEIMNEVKIVVSNNILIVRDYLIDKLSTNRYQSISVKEVSTDVQLSMNVVSKAITMLVQLNLLFVRQAKNKGYFEYRLNATEFISFKKSGAKMQRHSNLPEELMTRLCEQYPDLPKSRRKRFLWFISEDGWKERVNFNENRMSLRFADGSKIAPNNLSKEEINWICEQLRLDGCEVPAIEEHMPNPEYASKIYKSLSSFAQL